MSETESRMSLYGEAKLISNITSMTDEQLQERGRYFKAMEDAPETVPRQRTEASRLLGHYVFEITMRAREFYALEQQFTDTAAEL